MTKGPRGALFLCLHAALSPQGLRLKPDPSTAPAGPGPAPARRSPPPRQTPLRPPAPGQPAAAAAESPLRCRCRGRGCAAPTQRATGASEKSETPQARSAAPGGPPPVRSPAAPAPRQPVAAPPAGAGCHSCCPQSWPTPAGHQRPLALESSPGCGRSNAPPAVPRAGGSGWWPTPTATDQGAAGAAMSPAFLCPHHWDRSTPSGGVGSRRRSSEAAQG